MHKGRIVSHYPDIESGGSCQKPRIRSPFEYPQTTPLESIDEDNQQVRPVTNALAIVAWPEGKSGE